MAITYTWSITNLKTYKDDEGRDVVQTADWTLTGEDGEFKATTSGTTAFGAPDRNFVAFEELTEDLVVSWVQAELSEAYINVFLGVVSSSIADQSYKPKPLPWTQTKPQPEEKEETTEPST